jgi:adenosine deaminase
MYNLKIINEVKDLAVVGIGIGGSEHDFPPGAFKEVYAAARNMGFHTSAHAGEAAGAESIWSALNDLKAERLGHCTRAFEDPELVKYLKEQNVPLEMCPISNVKTGVVSSIGEHPIKEYFKNGLNVFVNTDDPEMFNNTMADEYFECVNSLGFTLNDVRQMGLNAISSAWCSEEIKKKLKKELNSYFESNKIE